VAPGKSTHILKGREEKICRRVTGVEKSHRGDSSIKDHFEREKKKAGGRDRNSLRQKRDHSVYVEGTGEEKGRESAAEVSGSALLKKRMMPVERRRKL